MQIRPVRRVAVAALTAVMAMVATISPAGAFTDVTPSHPFYTEISWAVNNGIVQGYPNNTFRGTNQVTRQAASAFIFRLAANPAYTPPGSPTFPDVATDHTFYREIEWMNAVGLTTGYSDGTFKPGSPVTRQAMAAYICRIFECYENAPHPNELPQFFFDVGRTHPFFIDITFMFIAEIADGYPYGFGYIFKPSGIVTRQAATAFLYRLDQLVISSTSTSGGTGTRSVPASPGWQFTPPELGTIG
jgi:hypothetical protein